MTPSNSQQRNISFNTASLQVLGEILPSLKAQLVGQLEKNLQDWKEADAEAASAAAADSKAAAAADNTATAEGAITSADAVRPTTAAIDSASSGIVVQGTAGHMPGLPLSPTGGHRRKSFVVLPWATPIHWRAATTAPSMRPRSRSVDNFSPRQTLGIGSASVVAFNGGELSKTESSNVKIRSHLSTAFLFPARSVVVGNSGRELQGKPPMQI